MCTDAEATLPLNGEEQDQLRLAERWYFYIPSPIGYEFTAKYIYQVIRIRSVFSRLFDISNNVYVHYIEVIRISIRTRGGSQPLL